MFSVLYKTIFLPSQFPLLMRRIHFLLATLFLFAACNTVQRPVRAVYEDYRITGSLQKDSSLDRELQPYRDSVNNTMNTVIGTLGVTLEKKQPEGSLGNFMADALLYSARKKFGFNADIATVNFGGIRLGQLPAGEVTNGKIFELMPFDNVVVIQDVRGDVLQSFLDLTAERGGWPFAGLTMQISNKKAVNVLIGGKPLDPSKTYKLVNSDYVASGGDNASMLKGISQQNIGYLMRDAFFDYIKVLKAEGKNTWAKEEKRVYVQ
jgi:2',3'-cyclic-nucleotide 2'-phosphodiesterase (5'-nucleotidase family)